MSRGPKAVPLELTETEWAELRRLLRRRRVGQALAQRVRVVLACAEPGATNLGMVVRTRAHQPTTTYVSWRTAEGKSKREIIRCLKHFVARETYGYLCRAPRAGSPMQITARPHEHRSRSARCAAEATSPVGAPLRL